MFGLERLAVHRVHAAHADSLARAKAKVHADSLAAVALLTDSAATLQPILEDGPKLRFQKEKKGDDVVTISYIHTQKGVPVWNSGMSVRVRLDTMEQHRDLAARLAAKAEAFANGLPKRPTPREDIALTGWLAKQKVVVDYAATVPTADTADGPAFRHAKAGRATYGPAGVRTEPLLVHEDCLFWHSTVEQVLSHHDRFIKSTVTTPTAHEHRPHSSYLVEV